MSAVENARSESQKSPITQSWSSPKRGHIKQIWRTRECEHC